MQTQLAAFIKDTDAGREADSILRSCVHCGFCNATCPTYQLLGDELDGPRGRIYLIKQMLEGQPVSERTQLHLDRCLSCRSCETTCPSGVNYHRLLDIGRGVIEQRVRRSLADRAKRFLLREGLTRPLLLQSAVALGRALRSLLPAALAGKLLAPGASLAPVPIAAHARRMIALASCGQQALTPNTNAATARVLDKLGIEMLSAAGAGCCGAMRYHLDAQEQALDDMRRMIDAWWPHIDDTGAGGVEAIVVSASGCGVQVREYGKLLAHDPAYAGKAARVAALARDVAEVLAAEQHKLVELLPERAAGAPQKVAFHSPCTLQHGQKIHGVVESLLSAAGYALTPVADAHLCCGSAGTYSITQPELARQLRDRKLAALGAASPDLILTANIGCQLHLQSGTSRPVRHWIEAIDEALSR